MKKNYVLILFLFVSTFSFAQIGTNIDNTARNAQPINNVLQVKEITSEASPVFEKIPLPSEKKTSPEIFYIIDDQPVDRQKYMASQKSNSVKK